MQINMNYGINGLKVDLPEDWNITLIEKKSMPVLVDPSKAMQKAFAEPEACPPLEDLARTARKACILICDITRPVPNGLVLPFLLRTLVKAGLDPVDITLLVATGLHRPNEGEEMLEVVGDQWVLDNFRVKNHFAKKDEDHSHIGNTSHGLEVKLDKRLLEADLRIAIGLVEPHFMAGYSGGRKLIMPGVAHADNIKELHNAHFMGHPKSATCVLEGNPLHEQQLEIVHLLDGAFAVNLVIDHKHRVSFINFGEIEQSHLRAVEFMKPYVEVPVELKYQTVLTSSAGYPLDATYYQTIKGMVAATRILAPGGDLIIVSEISEGMGSKEFVRSLKMLQKLGIDGFSRDIYSRQFAAIDEWQTQKLLEPLKIGNVFLYTQGLHQEEAALTGVNVVNDLQKILFLSAGAHKNLAVIPEGPYMFPFHSQT